MQDRSQATARAAWLAPSAVVAGLLAWLWPIGLGSRMPVGGDVTQFFLGLMAVLARSIRAGRLPLWNDLWGYGFPGLAESQMGVFYPPHWLLYGLLPLEAAYTASLVGHTIWGGLGAYWASRRFGASPAGSALGAFAWGASGFFLIHLPHQWGYTCGSWMPWAWGLAWPVARGEGSRRAPFLLALVLTLQLLPGHFQLAFTTQVGVAILGLWALVERAWGSGPDRPAPPPRPSSTTTREEDWAEGEVGRRARVLRGVAAVAIATASSFALAAAQVWPTWRLSRMAEADRDFEYLSGFAATPLHLISYVAPGLFHRSPLWRPLAWDPFHTSPEEHLAYVGLVPLFLALGAVARGWRRDPATRALAIVALVTLILSLGPYVPGFATLIRLPGFSFFRSPARWSLATEMALAMLAARGFDALRDWPRPGRWLASFAVGAAAATGLVLLVVELAIASTDRPGWPSVASGFERAMRLLPWSGDPPFRDLMATARRPLEDLRVRTSLARQGLPWSPASETIFVRKRRSVYASELGETGAILVALLIVSPFASRRRAFGAALVALSAIDLWAVGRHRATDLGPIRPLSSQSPVLALLAKGPPGARTADPLRNMPMVVGAAPIAAYRTLDIPSVSPLTRLALAPIGRGEADRMILGALRATGTAVRVLDPFETAAVDRSSIDLPGWEAREVVRDPALAGWLYGADLVAFPGVQATTFTVWRPPGPAARAWLVPLTEGRATDILEPWSGDPTAVIDLVEHATPLTIQADRPERLEIAVQADGPARVLVSQLADPLWEARWIGPGGGRPATVVPVLRLPGQGGWQAVTVPGPGAWTLRLEYSGRDVRQGLIASAVAWTLGIASFFWQGRGGRS